MHNWFIGFRTWWENNFLMSLKLSYKNIFKISIVAAIILSLCYFVPTLLVLLLNKDTLEFNKSWANLCIGVLLIFGCILIATFVIGIIYIVLGTKTELLRLSYNNIHSRFKDILKRSVLVSAILVLVVCIPQFFILLLNIDNPGFINAFATLVVFGFSSIIWLCIGFIILLCIIITIITIWRKCHHIVVPQSEPKMVDKQILPPNFPPATPTAQSSNSWPVRRILYMSISGISGFLYIMYYVGRAYCEGFFSSWGIPKDLISFQFYDYIYYGAQIDTILITVIFTAILLKLLITWFFQNPEQTKPYNKYGVMLVYGYLILYSVILLCCVFLQIFRSDLVIQKPLFMGILITCIVLLSFLVMILYFDQDLFSHIRSANIKKNIFIATVVITLLFSPYMSGKAWGAFKAQITEITNFPAVELYANRELIYGIEWIPVDNSTYKTNQELYLIMKTSEYIFVKTSGNTSPVYMFKPSDILSTKILYSENSTR